MVVRLIFVYAQKNRKHGCFLLRGTMRSASKRRRIGFSLLQKNSMTKNVQTTTHSLSSLRHHFFQHTNSSFAVTGFRVTGISIAQLVTFV
jgi:hypothetical protein